MKYCTLDQPHFMSGVSPQKLRWVGRVSRIMECDAISYKWITFLLTWCFLESSWKPEVWGNFPGLDVDKMDYLLRDAAALKINLKWEVRLFWVWVFESFQLERFLEAGEPKLMDFPWGQDKIQNNQNLEVINQFTAYMYFCINVLNNTSTSTNTDKDQLRHLKDENKNGVDVKASIIVKRIAVSCI